MVMAISILRGFQADIAGKVAGFGGHIAITSYAAGLPYNDAPVVADSLLEAALRQTEGVSSVERYATKGGMVKTESEIYGIVFRGVERGYDSTFYCRQLVEGRLPDVAGGKASNEVLISATIARKLGLAVGDKMRTYFWQGAADADNAAGAYRSRAFVVCGIYNTDLSDVDRLYVVGDLRQVQRLSGWDSTMAGGYELRVSDFGELDAVADRVARTLPYDLRLQTIVGSHPALFSWLDLLNANIALILTIMCLVCAVAIVSAILIMIFEKSSTIGLLKALGASGGSVRRIFMLKATQMVVTGIAIGEAVSVALSLAQQRWHIVTLDAESYSMAHVPVEVNGWVYAIVALATLAVSLGALLPTYGYIGRISPAKTMRTE